MYYPCAGTVGRRRVTVVAIHQPNYAPWLGYFHKIARSDVFVFLDNADYTKNSYINRVQIGDGSRPRWLTIPVSFRFGAPINKVQPARSDWRRSHLDTLKSCYCKAPAFAAVWPRLKHMYDSLPDGNLAQSNRALIEMFAREFGLKCAFLAASEIDTGRLAADNRLIAIVKAIAPHGTYLSGKGGKSYQDPSKFLSAGIGLVYSDFEHPVYDQKRDKCLSGLSVIDAIFHVGFAATAKFIV